MDSFLKELHAKVYEAMLEGEMETHLGYQKNAPEVKNSGNSRNGKYAKTIQIEYGESTIEVPRDRTGDFEPVVVPKH